MTTPHLKSTCPHSNTELWLPPSLGRTGREGKRQLLCIQAHTQPHQVLSILPPQNTAVNPPFPSHCQTPAVGSWGLAPTACPHSRPSTSPCVSAMVICVWMSSGPFCVINQDWKQCVGPHRGWAHKLSHPYSNILAGSAAETCNSSEYLKWMELRDSGWARADALSDSIHTTVTTLAMTTWLKTQRKQVTTWLGQGTQPSRAQCLGRAVGLWWWLYNVHV
jgi:hypothetical protein